MHKRWDDFLMYRGEAVNVPAARSLREARQRHIWIWVSCAAQACRMVLALPLAPLIIRWGPDILLEVVMRRARCTRCGGMGVRIREPSWEGGDRRCVPEIHRWTTDRAKA